MVSPSVTPTTLPVKGFGGSVDSARAPTTTTAECGDQGQSKVAFHPASILPPNRLNCNGFPAGEGHFSKLLYG